MNKTVELTKKKITIEEAANKANGYNLYAKETKAPIFNEGFIEGAKWQENNMYSEEDMRKMLVDMSNYINTKELKDDSDSTTYEWHRKRDWFVDYLIEIIEKNKK